MTAVPINDAPMTAPPMSAEQSVLEAIDVVKDFPVRNGWGFTTGQVHAVSGVRA